MTTASIDRRTFLGRSTIAALGTALLAPSLQAAEASPRYNAAVIGFTGRGDYGHGLEAIFSGRPNVDLVALVDPSPAGRTRMAAKLRARKAYADHQEMLVREKPDLVSVAMRHADLHHEIIRDCLNAGAHVYAEKPFVTAPFEADELLALADKRKLRVAVAHTMRMMPVVTRLRQAVREGLVGDLVQLRAYGKQDARAGGEDMMVLGTHLFDLMRLFAGDPFSCTARVLQGDHPIARSDRRTVKDHVGFVAGDQVFAQFSFAGGVDATFTSSARLRETIGHWGIELYGSKGAARINCDLAPNVFVRKTTGWSAKGKTDEWLPLDPAALKAPPEHNLGPVGDWLDAIANDREPECSGRNAAWAVEMVAAVYQSALQRTAVQLPLQERQHPLA